MVCGEVSVRVVGVRQRDAGSMETGGCVRDKPLLRIDRSVRRVDAITFALAVN